MSASQLVSGFWLVRRLDSADYGFACLNSIWTSFRRKVFDTSSGHKTLRARLRELFRHSLRPGRHASIPYTILPKKVNMPCSRIGRIYCSLFFVIDSFNWTDMMTHEQHELPSVSDERNKINFLGYMVLCRANGSFENEHLSAPIISPSVRCT